MPSHQLIKERRARLGLTQEQVVGRLQRHLPGFSVFHLSKLERGYRVVKADEIPAFATALNCRVDELLDPKPQ